MAWSGEADEAAKDSNDRQCSDYEANGVGHEGSFGNLAQLQALSHAIAKPRVASKRWPGAVQPSNAPARTSATRRADSVDVRDITSSDENSQQLVSEPHAVISPICRSS